MITTGPAVALSAHGHVIVLPLVFIVSTILLSGQGKSFPIHAHLSTVHHNVGPTYIAHDSHPTRSCLHAQPSPNAGLLAIEAPRLHHSMYSIGNMNESVELH